MHVGSESIQTPPETPVPPRVRRRFRWQLYLVVATACLTVLVLLAPRLASLPIVRSKFEQAATEALGARCRLDRLQLSWFSGLTVEGLTIDNPEGFDADRPCLRLLRVTADASFASLLSGPIELRGVVDGLELYVDQRSDGSSNLSALGGASSERSRRPHDPTAPPGPAPGPRPTPPPAPGTVSSSPEVRFDFELRNSAIEIRRDGQLLEQLQDARFRVHGDDTAVAVEAGGRLTGGELEADVRVDLRRDRVQARGHSRGLDLARWQPLVDALSPGQLTALRGRIDGELRVEVDDVIRVDGELTAVDVHVAGPLLRGMDVRGERWTLRPTLTVDPDAVHGLDPGELALDLGWLDVRGEACERPEHVRLRYAVDLDALAAFGGPIPAELRGSGARAEGTLELPTRDGPRDAAAWAGSVVGTARIVAPRIDVAGLELRDAVVDVALADGSCRLVSRESTRLEGGGLALEARIDLREFERLPTTATVRWRDGRLSGATARALRHVAPIFAGLGDAATGLQGDCDLDLELAGPGAPRRDRSWLQWLDDWSGRGEVALTGASFVPAPQLVGLLAPLGPLTRENLGIAADGRLRIDALRAPFTFAQGFVRTTAGEWLAAGEKVGLSGTVAFDGSLDYALDLSALLRGHRDGERVLEALAGTLPSARLRGTLDAPTLALPDTRAIAKRLLEQQGRDLLQKGLESLLPRKRQ